MFQRRNGSIRRLRPAPAKNTRMAIVNVSRPGTWIAVIEGPLCPKPDRNEARSLRRHDAFLEDEAAVEAPLAGGDDRESVLGALVKGEALDADQGHGVVRRGVDG